MKRMVSFILVTRADFSKGSALGSVSTSWQFRPNGELSPNIPEKKLIAGETRGMKHASMSWACRYFTTKYNIFVVEDI